MFVLYGAASAVTVLLYARVASCESSSCATTARRGRAVRDAEPRGAAVTASSDTEVLAIGGEEFYEILHEQVEIAEGVLRLLSARVREANAGD